MPVLRPVIGMDKDEIVLISARSTPLKPPSCRMRTARTVFTPKHPRTKPQLKFVKYAEEQMDASS